MDHKSLIKKPKSARGLETLNRLLSAAAQVFYEKGYHEANITDITAAAGLAAGTVYVYFDSKYTVSILFPFLRQIVATLTSTANVPTLMLPIMNFNDGPPAE